MLDKFHITSLSINEFLSNRFLITKKKTNLRRIFQIENQFKSFKNNIFDVLSNRMLV